MIRLPFYPHIINDDEYNYIFLHNEDINMFFKIMVVRFLHIIKTSIWSCNTYSITFTMFNFDTLLFIDNSKHTAENFQK